MKLTCKIDGEWITRLCDGGVSWLLQNEGDLGCRNGGTGVATLWERNGLPWEHSAGNEWEGDKKFNCKCIGGQAGWLVGERLRQKA